MNCKVSIIVAVAKDNAIGFGNKLLYWLPNDLKRFKALTTGHTVIMGRKTFESLPKGALPNRRNIVLTSQPGVGYQGAEVFSSLEEAVRSCEEENEVFIMGGASVYKQSLDTADRIYLTLIDDIPQEADAFFPVIDQSKWIETNRDARLTDEKHLYPYTFIDYEKR